MYDRAVQAGKNHVQIDGLPQGYRIGLSENGKKLQILTPSGEKINLMKDELEGKIKEIINQHKPVPKPADVSEFTTREITARDVREAKNLIKNGEYPQIIAENGTIWSIRSVTGRNGKEIVEIGPFG